MKIYNVYGYAIIAGYLLACAFTAPAEWGPWYGLLIGAAYLLFVWFSAGLYIADVLHMGIAHRALEYRMWFIKLVTVVSPALGVYVDPIAWVNRHRLHHRYSDHEGDPNKLASDGFWKTLYLCLFPYPCKENVANDAILQSRTFRVVASYWFAIPAQIASFCFLWWLARSLLFAVVLWVGVRVFALCYVNMVQNYWTHTPAFGYRRYRERPDNARNVCEWLPITATFSACLQDNHHEHAAFLRLSHDDSEYDFGFLTVKAMKAIGLVKATRTGATIPKDVPLKALGF